ncbi:MAG: M67 family metallopeptidase [Alphaproteobacteria bacterium]
MSRHGLHISLADISRIEAIAKSELPRECCGIMLGSLSGNGWVVSGIEESRNVADQDRNDRFEIDPALLLRIQKAARLGLPRMIGVYHSHPNGGAEPSQTDMATAWQTGMIWLITAVGLERIETRAYLREAAGFVPVPLQIMETGS